MTHAFSELHPPKDFAAGQSNIPVTGKVFGEAEPRAASQASLDFWLTSGPYKEECEASFAKTVGARHSLYVTV